MINIRRAEARGHFNHGWLDTYHSFSFGDYYDPEFVNFRCLRVLNEDFVDPSSGFPTHSHQDMEIFTYIISGSLEHRDSMDNHSVIVPGDIQRMTAGRGVTHSEFNPSDWEKVHLLQIWFLPREKGLEPGYEQKKIPERATHGAWTLILSPDGRESSVRLNQDVLGFLAKVEGPATLEYTVAAHRHAWLQIVQGEFSLEGNELKAGDGVAVSPETSLKLQSLGAGEVILFDLP